MHIERYIRTTDRYEVTEQVAAWLAITFHLNTLVKLKARSSINTGTVSQVGYQADATGTLSAYAAYLPYLSIQADLEEAAQHLGSGLSWFDIAIRRMQASILALEPQVIAQFEPNQNEHAAIEAYLSQREIVSEEARFALTQYFGSMIGYLILHKETGNSGPKYAIEALKASSRLTTLLAISDTDIAQMQNPENPTTELKQFLNQEVTSFFTFLRAYTPPTNIVEEQ